MNLILVKETIFFRGNKILIYDCVVSLSLPHYSNLLFSFSNLFVFLFRVGCDFATVQRTLTVGGRISVQLVSSLTRLDLTDLFVVNHLNPN